MATIFFPGSFNPFTKGHADILSRLLTIGERVIIGIGVNINKPASEDCASHNADKINDYIKKSGLSDRVEVITYSGLTAKEAKKREAAFIARGIRNTSDFEYEYSLATFNRETFGIETVFIPSDPAFAHVSSSAIRELMKYDTEAASKYLP